MVDSEELQEMVCEACMNKAPFLWSYAAHIAGDRCSQLMRFSYWDTLSERRGCVSDLISAFSLIWLSKENVLFLSNESL